MGLWNVKQKQLVGEGRALTPVISGKVEEEGFQTWNRSGFQLLHRELSEGGSAKNLIFQSIMLSFFFFLRIDSLFSQWRLKATYGRRPFIWPWMLAPQLPGINMLSSGNSTSLYGPKININTWQWMCFKINQDWRFDLWAVAAEIRELLGRSYNRVVRAGVLFNNSRKAD